MSAFSSNYATLGEWKGDRYMLRSARLSIRRWARDPGRLDGLAPHRWRGEGETCVGRCV